MKHKDECPDNKGYFDEYGGRFVPETLMPILLDMEKAYREAKEDPDFKTELDMLLRDYAGRPTSLTYAKRLSERLGGAKIYLKRDSSDLENTVLWLPIKFESSKDGIPISKTAFDKAYDRHNTDN